MDFSDAYNKSTNFCIKKIEGEKVLIQIPSGNGTFEGEFNQNDEIGKILNYFKNKNGIDISGNFLKNFQDKNGIQLSDKIKSLLDNQYIVNVTENNMISYLIGKPFNNPFEIFVFNRIKKILDIKSFDDDLINSLGLNDYSNSSAYCNGNNHLYISGGEIKDNQIMNKFFDINLKDNNIDGPCVILPKKNHSMIFIPPGKVFMVGGNDTKAFYFDTKDKQVKNISDLNINRTEPALQVIGNILYCFDNVNKADNVKISFEKIDFSNPEAQWEIIYPNLNQSKFSQKFFAVSKDNLGENIIFLGGNMDDNIDSEELKNYKYNVESNLVEQTNIPFHDFNYKEKTFLSFNKNVDYLLPDFNRQHPEVTFFVKNKNRFEKISLLPKADSNIDINYAHRNKYRGNKYEYDFNMPITNSNLDIQNQFNVNIKVGEEKNNNLPGIEEPSFNKNIDLEKNLKIELEPPFKEPDIEPNKGDQQINIEIPNQLLDFKKGMKKIKNNMNLNEEEKNAEEIPENKMKFKNNQNSKIYNSFNLLNNSNNPKQQKYANQNSNFSVKEPGNDINADKKGNIQLNNLNFPNFESSANLNPELQMKSGIKLEGDINHEIMEPNIHMPNKGGLDLEEIKLNVQADRNMNVGIKGPEINLNEKDININAPNTDIKKDINVNIPEKSLNINGPKINVKGRKNDININTETDKKLDCDFFLGGTILGNKEPNSKEFTMYGIINGNKDYKKNKIDINIPKVKVSEGEMKSKDKNILDKNIKIEDNLPNNNYNINIKGMNMKTELKGPNISGKETIIGINEPKLKIGESDINVDTNNIKNKNPSLELNGPSLNLNKKDLNIEGNIPGVDINLKSNDINENIDLPNINSNIEVPNVDIKSPDFNMKGKDLNLNYPEINLKQDSNLPQTGLKIPNIESKKIGLEIKEDIQNIDINKPKLDMKISSPKMEIKGEIPNIEKQEGDFNLSGIIPGINVGNDNNNIKGTRRLYGSNINADIKDINLRGPKMHFNKLDQEDLKGARRLDMDMNMNNNIKSSSNYPKLNIPKVKGNLDIKGDINKPKINEPQIDVDIKDIETKNVKINIKKPKIYENITGVIKGKKLEAPKIDAKLNGPKLSGEISGKGNIKRPSLGIKEPKIDSDKKIDINIDKPEIGITSGDIDIKEQKINLPGLEMKGELPGIDVNSPKLDIKGNDLNINGPKFNLSNNKNLDFKGGNIKVDGKLPNANISGKNEIIISSGIIKGTKKLEKTKVKVPDVNIGGIIKRPSLNNFNIDQPKVDIDLKTKELDLDKNINNININSPEMSLPTGNINLKGKATNLSLEGGIPKAEIDLDKPKMGIDVKIPNSEVKINDQKVDIDANLPNAEIGGKMPNMDLARELPKLNIEGKMENVALDIDKPKFDINTNLPKEDLYIKNPELDINANIPKMDIIGKIDSNLPNINIKENLPSGEINIDSKIPNLEVNSPKIDLPSGDMNIKTDIPDVNIKGNIENKDIKIPNIDASIKQPELKGIKANLNMPNVDINKPEIDANGNFNLEGEIKGIEKPKIEIPKVDVNIKNKKEDFILTGIIEGYNTKNIDLKGSRRLDINQPELNIKSPNIKIEQPNINLKGSRRLDINQPDINIKSSKIKLEQPDINLKGSRRIDIPDSNLDLNFKGSNRIDNQINPPNIDVPASNLNINEPKIEGTNLNKVNIKGPNVNIDGKLPKPDLNIKGKNEIIISSGIIKGTKKLEKPKVNVPDVNIKGDIKGPSLNIPNVDEPKVDINLKTKEIDLNKNIKDVEIKTSEKNLPTSINLDIKKPDIGIDGNINNVDIDINGKKLDVNANVPEMDLKANKPKIDINGNFPIFEMNGEIGGNSQNLDIKNNIKENLPSGEINIDSKIPNLEVNSPKIDLPSGDMNIKTDIPDVNIKGNIENKDIKIPNIDASIKQPELKGIKANLNMPNVDINKPEIDANGNFNLEGEIKGIEKPKIEIPKVDVNIKNKKEDFILTGIIEGYNTKNIDLKGSRRLDINQPELNIKSPNIKIEQPNINLKGSRRLDINQPDINIKSSKIKLEQPDINLKGSRRIDIPDSNLDLNFKGSHIFHNNQINSNIKNQNNREQIVVNSPKIDINSGGFDLKANKPEIKKKEEEIIMTGIIGGNKSLKNNSKIKVAIPNFEMKGKLEHSNTPKKDENQIGIIPSSKNVNLEVKKYDLMAGQNIDLKLPNVEIKDASNDINNNIEIKGLEINKNDEIKMPEVNLNVNANNKNEINIEDENKEKGINIELQNQGINRDLDNKEQNNKLFNININNNIGENNPSLEDSNIRISHNAKKKGLPMVGSKNTQFKASRIDVGGKLDVNNIDITNKKSVKVGDRIIE